MNLKVPNSVYQINLTHHCPGPKKRFILRYILNHIHFWKSQGVRIPKMIVVKSDQMLLYSENFQFTFFWHFLLSRNRGPNQGLPTLCFGIPSPILLAVPLPMLGEEGQSRPLAFASKGGVGISLG